MIVLYAMNRLFFNTVHQTNKIQNRPTYIFVTPHERVVCGFATTQLFEQLSCYRQRTCVTGIFYFNLFFVIHFALGYTLSFA